MISAERSIIRVDSTRTVSALFDRPPAANALLILAHGAGAGMEHPSMRSIATGLGRRNIATLRYQFPYMEQNGRRPDPPALCHATVRAAVAEAARLAPDLPLIAGGRSFGGRMTSQAQAQAPLLGIRGLVFLGFPLHPAGRPGVERATHLRDIRIPMMFIQGTRDALANLELLQPIAAGLGELVTLHRLQDADHSFHVPARSGRRDSEVQAELLDALCNWVTRQSVSVHEHLQADIVGLR
ncbi:MAG TPA: alpha/beta family hydrolase [Steroidobacteraceae bacterium]|jgi:hypothetical protein|nr:alpha/beta family hydrolase [Steroidobacteraceae bacterium]